MTLWLAKLILFVVATSQYNHCVLTLNLKHYKLYDYNDYKPIDAAVIEYFEQKTYMISIAIQLSYTLRWESYISDYLSTALKQAQFLKYEIFARSYKPIEQFSMFSYYNLWYVDSYKGFR